MYWTAGPRRFVWREVFGVYVLTYHELFDWSVTLHGEDLDCSHARWVVEAAGFNW